MLMTKTKNTLRLGWLGRHKIFSIFILLVLASVTYIIYARIQTANNRRDFQQARGAIDSIYTDVLHNVGTPDRTTKTQDCTRRYQEFTGYGDLTCHLNAELLYPVNNEFDANDLLQKVQQLIRVRHNDFIHTGAYANGLKDREVISSIYHSTSDKYKSYGLSCIVNYVYDTPREIDLVLSDKSSKPLEVTIGCYGPAKQPYFTLVN